MNKRQPKISVILPAYNHVDYIEETIKSVLNQTYKDFEFIICDDASTDGTVEKILAYEDQIDEIHLFDVNAGARGKFFRSRVKGEYIAVINSDDVWMPDKLEKQIKVLEENSEAAACFTWCDRIDENGIILEGANPFCVTNRSREEWLNYLYFYGNCFGHASALIRREEYLQFGKEGFEKFRQIPDYYMWVMLAQQKDIVMLEERLTQIRTINNKERINVSALTKENLIRQFNEESYMWYKVISQMDDEIFLKAFSKQLIDNQAKSATEVMCEKFMILLQAKLEFSRTAAFFFFYDNYVQMKEWLLERYNFTNKDFYHLVASTGIGGIL